VTVFNARTDLSTPIRGNSHSDLCVKEYSARTAILGVLSSYRRCAPGVAADEQTRPRKRPFKGVNDGSGRKSWGEGQWRFY